MEMAFVLNWHALMELYSLEDCLNMHIYCMSQWQRGACQFVMTHVKFSKQCLCQLLLPLQPWRQSLLGKVMG